MLVAFLFLAGTGLAQDELPEGPGKKLFLRSCTSCHGASMIIGEGHGNAEWATTVATMAKRGAQGTEDEFAVIVEYLAKNFPATTNMNEATAKELQAQLELSPAEADAVVQYREKNGKIKDWDDLKKTPGLDAAKLESKKERLVF